MKRFLLTGLLVLAASFFIKADVYAGTYIPGSGDTYSDYVAGEAANGIGASRHNLGAWGYYVNTGSTTEICVFCHTPHHSNTDAKPMWNKGGTDVTFKAYDTDGTTIGGTSTGVSIYSAACLTCHDGTTAFDNLVNAPGKGGVNPGGSNYGWRFQMGNVIGLPGVVASFDHFGKSTGLTCDGCHNDVFGITDQAKRLNIGDYGDAYDTGAGLSNDHPVGVTYRGGEVASLRDSGTVIADINLTEDLEDALGDPQGSGALWDSLTQNRWAVYGFISDSATISNLLRDNKVECTSCNDPHFKNSSWDEVDGSEGASTWDTGDLTCGSLEKCGDGNFLRRVGGNTGSGVCRTCHNK